MPAATLPPLDVDEVDFVLEVGRRREPMAIECKSLVPEFPLVVSCVPRASDENYHDLPEIPRL